jgi:hypothetical protein
MREALTPLAHNSSQLMVRFNNNPIYKLGSWIQENMPYFCCADQIDIREKTVYDPTVLS